MKILNWIAVLAFTLGTILFGGTFPIGNEISYAEEHVPQYKITKQIGNIYQSPTKGRFHTRDLVVTSPNGTEMIRFSCRAIAENCGTLPMQFSGTLLTATTKSGQDFPIEIQNDVYAVLVSKQEQLTALRSNQLIEKLLFYVGIALLATSVAAWALAKINHKPIRTLA